MTKAKSATTMLRRMVMAAALAACGLAGTARAGVVTDLFQFDNTSTLGGTVSGTFSYDDSGSSPYTVTNFTLSDSADPGFSFNSATDSVRDTYLFFSNGFLFGDVNETIDPSGSNPSYEHTSGSFNGVLNFGNDNRGDAVHGSITITPEAAATPEPATLVMAAGAATMALAGAWRRRKPRRVEAD